MSTDSNPKTLKLKKVEIICKVKGLTSVVCWKDEKKVYLLTKMHNTPPSYHLWKKKKKMHQNLHALKVTTVLVLLI
jgi:hypothetical protein